VQNSNIFCFSAKSGAYIFQNKSVQALINICPKILRNPLVNPAGADKSSKWLQEKLMPYIYS